MMLRYLQRVLGVLVLTALVLGAGWSVRADVTITTENEVKTPTRTHKRTVTQYYTPTKMRMEGDEGNVSIIDFDNERMVALMPATKTYTERTLDELKEQGAQAEVPELTVTVEETDETEEINGYTCRKIIVRASEGDDEGVITHTAEHWMTADAEGVETVREFMKKMADAFKDLSQAGLGLEAKKELAEKGLFPIKRVDRWLLPHGGEVVVTATVTKIEEGELDDELFEIPEDYTEQAFDPPVAPGESESE